MDRLGNWLRGRRETHCVHCWDDMHTCLTRGPSEPCQFLADIGYTENAENVARGARTERALAGGAACGAQHDRPGERTRFDSGREPLIRAEGPEGE